MDEYESLSHTRWDCKYHVVFIPKCRGKALYGDLRRYLGKLFRKLAAQKESRIEERHLMPDHVRMMIAIPPKYAVSQVVELYQDYMLPNGMAWRAEAWLKRRNNDVCRFTLFRAERDSPFLRNEIGRLNLMLQHLSVSAALYSSAFERLTERQTSMFDRSAMGYSRFWGMGASPARTPRPTPFRHP